MDSLIARIHDRLNEKPESTTLMDAWYKADRFMRLLRAHNRLAQRIHAALSDEP